MLWFVFALLWIPAFAAAWIWFSRRPSRAGWPVYLQRIGLLCAAGLCAAAPLVTNHGLGTDEAYNYSLATADAVRQFREGVFPVLVGQTEFAFNGRIHPLRTAPFLAYFAGAIDTLTFRQLNFWALQNLALTLSLLGATFSMYASLRRSTGASPLLRLVLSAAYVLSPGVLAAVYSMDLYMTVMTLPFVPLVIGAALRTLRGERTAAVYSLLGAGLAAAWLAHPPVALWLTVGVIALELPLVLGWRLTAREWLHAAGGAALCLLLCGYSFVSALSIQDYQVSTENRDTATTIAEVGRVFKASLHPVSSAANLLSDFQLGYAYWGALALALLFALLRRRPVALLLCGVAGFYLALTTPVPVVNTWLWDHVPTMAATLTSYWPMQRLYLLITAFALFGLAAAGGLPSLGKLRPKLLQDVVGLALIALAGWTLYQSWHFIGRGFSTRASAEKSELVHRPENINLTVTSYAFIGAPPYFVNGVMDPTMEFRLRKPATMEVLASNWDAPASLAAPVQQGTFRSTGSEGAIELSPRLKLEPGQRYRLDFTFPPVATDGFLQITGPHSFREYKLPQAGLPEGFGSAPGNNHALTLWTTESRQEELKLQLAGSSTAPSSGFVLADFTLRPIDASKLPVEVLSWVPLRLKVNSPAAAYLETPRLHVRGYVAKVNGERVRAQESLDRLVMFPVPAGESQVELSYEGPAAVRATFWAAVVGWLGFFCLGTIHVLRPERRERPRAAAHSRKFLTGRRIAFAVALALLCTAGFFGWQRWKAYQNAAGPLHIRLILPRKETGRSQPLVTTGKTGAGTFIFMQYIDPTHIRIGLDVWGQPLVLSDPIQTDYFSVQDFVVSSGALYPPGHPKLKNVPAAALEALRQRITVSLNGKVVLDRPVFSFESTVEEVTVGASRIGVSNTEPKFVGQILKVERLPIPEPAGAGAQTPATP